jgi:hypothetical protein
MVPISFSVLRCQGVEVGENRIGPHRAGATRLRSSPDARPPARETRRDTARTRVLRSARSSAPWGSLRRVELAIAPDTPARPRGPGQDHHHTERVVHCRAAAAGATTSALIRTTPRSGARSRSPPRGGWSGGCPPGHGKPDRGPNSGSNDRSLNSFQKSARIASATIPPPRRSGSRPAREACGLAEEEGLESRLRGRGHALHEGQDHEPEPEEDRKDDPEGGVLGNPGVLHDPSTKRVPIHPARAAPRTRTGRRRDSRSGGRRARCPGARRGRSRPRGGSGDGGPRSTPRPRPPPRGHRRPWSRSGGVVEDQGRLARRPRPPAPGRSGASRGTAARDGLEKGHPPLRTPGGGSPR